MKQAEVLEIIKRELRNGILPFGFEVAIGQRNTIVIEKNERNDTIIKEFGVIIYDDFKVEDFFTLITILEIENVVTPILRKNGLIGGADDELMVTSSLNKLEPELFEINLNPSYPKTIATEQDFLELMNDLKQYTEEVAEPFFEKWSDLRVVDKFLDTVPQMEVQNYINEGVLSKALIYKLCNNPPTGLSVRFFSGHLNPD